MTSSVVKVTRYVLEKLSRSPNRGKYFALCTRLWDPPIVLKIGYQRTRG